MLGGGFDGLNEADTPVTPYRSTRTGYAESWIVSVYNPSHATITVTSHAFCANVS